MDKIYKNVIQISKEKQTSYDEVLKQNEKLRIQLEGAKEANKNLEYHHKDYIIKMKKEHRKTLSSIDNIYNQNGMEYEDLYTQFHRLHQDNADNMGIIVTLKTQIKGYKDQLRRAKEDNAEFAAKYDVSKKHIEDLRNEHQQLESEVQRKNKDILELTNK